MKSEIIVGDKVLVLGDLKTNIIRIEEHPRLGLKYWFIDEGGKEKWEVFAALEKLADGVPVFLKEKTTITSTQNYIIRKHKLNGNWNFDIEQENLIYSDCAPTHHGLQCNHMGDSVKYKEIMSLCDQVSELIRKIDKLNETEN